MNSRQYDIIRKDHDKLALWLEAASDLRAAESRIAELNCAGRVSSRSWTNRIIRSWRRSLGPTATRAIEPEFVGWGKGRVYRCPAARALRNGTRA